MIQAAIVYISYAARDISHLVKWFALDINNLI